MDWIKMKEIKENLNAAILPFDEMTMLIGSIQSYIQIKPDQKEELELAAERLRRQRQSCMNIVSLGSMVNANIKECVLTKKDIDGISRAFLLHKVMSDNIQWGDRAYHIVEHLVEMNKCFKEAVKFLVNEELGEEE